MIVCLCEGLNDRALREEIRNGATSSRDLVQRTGAGSHCGLCACDLKRLVREEIASSTPEDLEVPASK